MSRTTKEIIALVGVLTVVLAIFGGINYVATHGHLPKAKISTKCVAYQTRVIESDKTTQFHVMWDETCK